MTKKFPDNYYLEADDFYASGFWRDLREKILQRDSHECLICGATGRLHVHHMVPRMYRFVVGWDINRVSNLITVCDICHTFADRKYVFE